MNTKYGYLAKEFGGEDIPLQVCHSAAGYYIGTMDPKDGFPFSRESQDYYGSFLDAQNALDDGTWIQRQQP